MARHKVAAAQKARPARTPRSVTPRPSKSPTTRNPSKKRGR